MEESTKRKFLLDNVKGLLILAVVAGHIMEPYLEYTGVKICYSIIYAFHMPLFSYCSGYLAKYNPEKIKKDLLYPYLIFQTSYLLFLKLILHQDKVFQFSRPYWLLWYLVAMIVWKMLLPFVETKTKGGRVVWLTLAIAAGLLAGYDNSVGYMLSLSRIVVFFPFFLMGYYQKECINWESFCRFREKKTVRCILILLTAGILWGLIRFVGEYRVSWLYGSVSYAKGHYSVMFRALYDLCALGLGGFFLCFLPDRKISMGWLGRHCMPIYLLHGFILCILNS